MTALTAEIDPVALARLRDLLHTTTLYDEAVSDLIQGTALYMQGQARKYANPHGGDTGELARSIQLVKDSGPTPLYAKIRTNKIYAAAANYGRKPGKMPPLEPIRQWLRRHGLPEQWAFPIARKIARGTSAHQLAGGLRFMDKAAAEGEQYLRDGIRDTLAEIEARWRRTT